MQVLKGINKFRRGLMHQMTRSVGHRNIAGNPDSTKQVRIERVLICRPNGRLGNLLLITPLLQDVVDTFPGCKIDLFVKGGLAPILFKHYENINTIIELPRRPFKQILKYIHGWMLIRVRHYDMVINAVKDSSSGRLSTKFARATYKIFENGTEDLSLLPEDHGHIAKYPVYAFRDYLSRLGFPKNEKPVPCLALKLSLQEVAAGREALYKLVNSGRKTICLFTYATGDKCYPAAWWEVFFERLKYEYRDHNIIEMLPIQNVSMISFKAPSFYSRDVREMGSLIANTEVFIGADSGVMHLANSVHTPTIGLFSVTNQNKYRPYGNQSTDINTNDTNIDEWIGEISKILVRP